MEKTATYFSFKSYEWNPENKRILFHYEIGFRDSSPINFTETVTVPEIPNTSRVPETLLRKLLGDLHIILGISYYKLYCPGEIRTAKPLTEAEAIFWETVYRKGLGEFAYRNNLDLRPFIQFPRGNAEVSKPVFLPQSDRALMGIGGGKDSVVALELLREYGIECAGLIVETYAAHEIAQKVCEIAGIQSFAIRRTLDEKVFERLPGSFSGHIPISAVYAFLGMFAAILYDYKYVVVGNEYSSNFGNVMHHGEEVNHQWSKSMEFELMLRDFMRTRIGESARYFSLMRPFYEIRIAELFSHYPQYFEHFTSCNRKFRMDEKSRPRQMWCGECPKCAFVFLMLAPFIERDELLEMFGRNLLDDRSLLPMYTDILGFGTMKPFDCVGTFDEARAALYLAKDAFKDDVILQELLQKIENGADLVPTVMRAQRALSLPPRFRILGMKNALILGYGKEGKSTEKFLKREYPELVLGIADESKGDEYLKKQNDFDIVVKTAGLPKEKVYTHYTTATNIFFSEWKGITVGVTGSKGKSTTASLIAAMLAKAKLPVHLAGNIGFPMLDLLSLPHDEKSIAVLELSSYQLDDIEFSPHIAVVTALFPEHMDYHGSEDAYYNAKRNIVRFQNETDVFISSDTNPQFKDWAKETSAQAVSYAELPFDESIIPLLGVHNIENVRAAVTVARLFGVADADIESAVRNFKSLPHRLEFVGEFNGIKFYDDAISTSPESTIAAIDALQDIQTIFLGGHDRGYDFTELEKQIRARGIQNIVLFPESGNRLFRDREGLNILETDDMEAGVKFAYTHTEKGMACVLSCASPSYGLWKNFEEKGDAFQQAVKMLQSGA